MRFYINFNWKVEELIMKKVSIFNIKGGVAKTTSTANLGACLSQQCKKVY